ncbi:MAG: arginine--tRNA ligase [Pseudomonadota bacterium]
MNIFAELDAKVRATLDALKADGSLLSDLDLAGIEVQEPRDPSHGDAALNAAMVLAKRAQKKPREIAELIAARLADDAQIAAVDVAGPGFINVRFEPTVWEALVADIFARGTDFGRSDFGAGRSVQVEYVSANPTGPMHIGHCRGAVFGDALAAVLAAVGYDVTREYYINDAGAQVDKLGQSAVLRYREALGEDIGQIPEGLYPGAYLKPVGETLKERYGDALLAKSEPEQISTARDAAIDLMMDMIRSDLGALGVRHDVFFSERSLNTGDRDQVAEAIAVLRDEGLIFEGLLPRPKGHDEDDWEEREQTLFRSTEFGDDMNRALMKSDGTYTYFANDVAYHYNKVERGFDQMFNVLGADHIGYIPRIKAAVAALSGGKADFQTPVCNLVKVMRNGEPVRMSKRAGTFVELRDVVDEVGRDPVRFMMLMNKSDTPIDFDLAKVVEQSRDNPVFYVQYAHARLASVFRKAADQFPELALTHLKSQSIAMVRLSDDGEQDLLRQVSRYPRLLLMAAREREPHRLPRYLFDLASALHAQWGRGNDNPALRFIREDDPALTKARLQLMICVQTVLASGLDILGVDAPDTM